MKVRLLVVSGDSRYTNHLSKVLSERYFDVFETGVCSTREKAEELLSKRKYDVLLLEPAYGTRFTLPGVALTLLLDDGQPQPEGTEEWQRVPKYQRISIIVGDILEKFAEIAEKNSTLSSRGGRITTVWSPAGGVGKTTAAIAYAESCARDGRQTAYLDMEYFSSTPAFFQEDGRSISTAFEKLSDNVGILLRSIQQTEPHTGVIYYGSPTNYDDMHILSMEDVQTLVSACADSVDELVVDLPSVCDERTKWLFEASETVLLVSSPTPSAQAKLRQFVEQNTVYDQLRDKLVLVENRGACRVQLDAVQRVSLPVVKAADPGLICRKLSVSFGWER